MPHLIYPICTQPHTISNIPAQLQQQKVTDGRILVVEYKGLHLWSNDDSKEKRAVGDLWAARSKGTCLFVMPNGPDYAAIARTIGGNR